MKNEKIMLIGAGGQIGIELLGSLRDLYGSANVIATDIQKKALAEVKDTGPYAIFDATDGNEILSLVKKNHVTQIYHLAALLSATGEIDPIRTWQVNMQSLTNVLEISRQEKIAKIYWPSSIAAFGITTPRVLTPQVSAMEPETMYGITKSSGELLCQYYFKKWGVDVRSLRYPGLISWKKEPGGGTTDYAVQIFYDAIKYRNYTCFLSEGTYLPMMYMDDAIRATMEVMESPAEKIKIRTAYNISAMSFCPDELAEAIKVHLPEFKMKYKPDYRQKIADSWPQSISDSAARRDWGWAHRFELKNFTAIMLEKLREKLLLERAITIATTV